jgi:hypothetical protein
MWAKSRGKKPGRIPLFFDGDSISVNLRYEITIRSDITCVDISLDSDDNFSGADVAESAGINSMVHYGFGC